MSNLTWAESSGYVSADGLANVRQLVEHGEPAEGMCILAWVIVNERVQVPSGLVAKVRALAEDLVSPSAFPDDLDEHAIAIDAIGRAP